LALGGYDSSKFVGDISWVPVSEQDWWTFDFTGSYRAGTQYGATSGIAIADTGTSLIYLETEVAAAINGAFGATYDSDYGVYLADCSAALDAPNVTLSFGGSSFVIPASRYILNDGGLCFSAFLPGADGVSVPTILGDVFLRVYYSIYDKSVPRIGFAEAVQPSGFGSSGNTTGTANNVTGSLFTGDIYKYGGGPVLGSVVVNPIYYGDVAFEDELTEFYSFIVGSEYMDVLSVYSTNDTTTSKHMSPEVIVYYDSGESICDYFCAVHGSLDVSDITGSDTPLFFGLVPDQLPSCICNIYGYDNFDAFTVLTVTASNLLAVAVTDPDPGSGWINELGEINELCLYDAALTSANAAANDFKYSVHQVFSNKDLLCISSPDPSNFSFPYPYGSEIVSVVDADTFRVPNTAVQSFETYYAIYLVVDTQAPVEAVLVEFTESDWSVYNTEAAKLLTTFDDGKQALYGLFWFYGYISADGSLPEVAVRGMVQLTNGTIIEDPNNDYWIVNHATETDPIYVVTDSAATLASDNTIHIGGSVRTLGFDPVQDFANGTVKYNCSTDSWATSSAVDAVLDPTEKTWTYDFNAGSLSDADLPATISCTVDYHSSRGLFTVAGIAGTLRPTAVYIGDDGQIDAGIPLDGHYLLLIEMASVLDLDINNGATAVVSIDGVPQDVPFYLTVDSGSLAEGPHNISVTSLVSTGGSVTVVNDFTVSHTFANKTLLKSGKPAYIIGLNSTTLAVAKSTSVSLFSEVSGLSLLATLTPPAVVTSTNPLTAVHVDAVEDAFFALDSSSNFIKYNSTLELDEGFGEGGILATNYSVVDFAVHNGSIYVMNADSLLLVGHSGELLKNITFDGSYTLSALALDPDTSTLLVAVQNVSDSSPRTLVTLDAATAEVQSTVALQLDVPSKLIRNLSPLGSDRIVVSVYNAIYILDRVSGATLHRWLDVYVGYSQIVPAAAVSGIYVANNAGVYSISVTEASSS
ncbi:Vacuolar protease A, partial [Cladochytrium tenue]